MSALFDGAFARIVSHMDTMVTEINHYIDSTGSFPSITEGEPAYEIRLSAIQEQLSILYREGVRLGILPEIIDARKSEIQKYLVTAINATECLFDVFENCNIDLYKDIGFYMSQSDSASAEVLR
jgi:hypothetical protein